MAKPTPCQMNKFLNLVDTGKITRETFEAFLSGERSMSGNIVEVKIGDRTYELLKILRDGETRISGSALVERAKEMDAHLGEEDARYIMEHQGDIPVALRGKIDFVFLGWRRPDGPDDVACLYWYGGVWNQSWRGIGSYWVVNGRLVRSK